MFTKSAAGVVSKTHYRDTILLNSDIICLGGGYQVGKLSSSGQLTGNQVSFLYPDLTTGLTGTHFTGYHGLTGDQVSLDLSK